jgi:hypothetical protein
MFSSERTVDEFANVSELTLDRDRQQPDPKQSDRRGFRRYALQ